MKLGATIGATGATWDFFLSEAPIYEGCNILSPSLEGKVAPIFVLKRKNKEAVTNLLFRHNNPCATVLLRV